MMYYSYVPDLVSGFPPAKPLQSPVDALARFCVALGWSEPQYETLPRRNGPTTLYSCRVYIVQGLNGQTWCPNVPEYELFSTPEAAKTAAAGFILPRLQYEISLYRNQAALPYFMPALAQPTAFAN
jgi:hypothetical protein